MVLGRRARESAHCVHGAGGAWPIRPAVSEFIGQFDQAGAIPWRVTERGVVEALLITTSAGRWLIPKGTIDSGSTARQTAMNEALEEAGVMGFATESAIGVVTDARADSPRRIAVFGLRVERVLSRWQEQGRRERAWMPCQDAALIVGIPAIGSLMLDLARHIRDASLDAA